MERLRRALIYVACAIFAVALVRRYYFLGAPYFAIPETIQDHVSFQRLKSRDAIVICSRAARMLPRGAKVRILADDPTVMYVAIGVMPYQSIAGDDADYVITIGSDVFGDPRYGLTDEFPEGKIYTRR